MKTLTTRFLPLLLMLLPACQDERRSSADGTDINAAAAAAQGDIDTYAENTLTAPPPSPVAARIPPTVPGAAPIGDAAAAGAVAREYYGLIAARRYAEAYRLWDDDGRASGMTVTAFADSFARYADYRAQIGAPGRIDAGAGQRHVEVPVRIAGRLVEGNRPSALAGTVTLHRVGDIDGATADQRRWRISDTSIRPRPGDTAAREATSYACVGETRISVRFDSEGDTATLDRDGGAPVVMAGQRPASGIWYRGGGYELRGKGREADFTAPGAEPVACTAH